MFSKFFYPIAELATSARTPTNEANAEIETHPMSVGMLQGSLKTCILLFLFTHYHSSFYFF